MRRIYNPRTPGVGKRRIYRLIPSTPLVPDVDVLSEEPYGIPISPSYPSMSYQGGVSYPYTGPGYLWYDTGSYPGLRFWNGTSWEGVLRAWALEAQEYIQIGTGTPGVDFTGIRIYRDGDTYRVSGWNNNTLQFYINSDGKGYAGGGDVVFDENGITLSVGAGAVNRIKWGADIYMYGTSGGDLILVAPDGVEADQVLLKDGAIPDMRLGSPTELTISNGAITVTQSYHIIDTEGDAATDDLTDIAGGAAGMMLVLQTASNTRDVTIKNNAGAAGTNIRCDGSADIALTQKWHKAVLIFDPEVNHWVAFKIGA